MVGLDEAYLELTGAPGPGRDDASDGRARSSRRPSCTARSGSARASSWPRSPPTPRSRAGSSSSPASRPASASPAPRCGLVPGIGPKTAERLRALGIRTLGELRRPDPGELAERFGRRSAAELQRRARFEDDAPVTQERKVISESRETTFDLDISDPVRLEEIARRPRRRGCATALESQGRCGRTIGIKVRLDDFSTHTRARTLAEPVWSARSGRAGGARPAAAVRRAPAGAAARRARRRPAADRRARGRSAHARRLSGRAQYSAEASRRRASRASGFSTPSSSSTPTITRRMSSRAPSASWSAASSRSSARSGSPASSAANASGELRGRAVAGAALERDPRREALGREVAGHAAQRSRAPRRRLPARAGSAPAERPRRRGRARARPRGAATPRRLGGEQLGLGGEQRVEEPLDRRGRLGADELAGDRPVPERLDRRDALDPERARRPRVRVDVDLRELDLPPAGGHAPARAPARAAGTGRTIRPRSRRPPAASASAR